MKVVGIIEARMGSARLPGKTLMELFDGKHLLDRVVQRFKLCREVGEIVVATTTAERDDPIVRWCEENRVCHCRGSEEDVLHRVACAVVRYDPDVIVQMGADSAYLDFDLIDRLVATYRDGDYDYVCNDLVLTYPLGIYGHVVSAPTLMELNEKKDLSTNDREDVVRYIWEHPDKYRILNITAPQELAYPELRFTVDYLEDMQLAREIYTRFKNYAFGTMDLISLYKQEPEIFDKTKNLVQISAPFIKVKYDGS